MQMDLRYEVSDLRSVLGLDSRLNFTAGFRDEGSSYTGRPTMSSKTNEKAKRSNQPRNTWLSLMVVGPRCLCCARFMAAVLLAKSLFAFTKSALVYGPAHSVAARSIRYCQSSFCPSVQRVVGSSIMAPAKTATSTRPRRAAAASTAVDASSQGEKDQKLTKVPKKTLVETKDTAKEGRKRKVTSESSAAKSSKSDDDDVTSTEISTSSESPANEKKKRTTKGANDSNQNDSSPTSKAKAPRHQVLTERDELPKLWTDEMAKAKGSYSK
jgi:hypothetical protein